MYILKKNNKKKFFSRALSKCIGMGSEVSVFSYKGKVVKIYPHIVSKNKAKELYYFSHLKTDRIVMPEDFVYGMRGIKGYTSCKIVSNGNIYNLVKSKIINEIREVEKELVYLAHKRVKVNDFIMQNFIFDNKIRFIDVGRYVIDNKSSIDEIVKYNLSELRYFLFNDLFYICGCNSSNCYTLAYQLQTESFINDELSPSEYLDKSMNDGENLDLFVKRMFC